MLGLDGIRLESSKSRAIAETLPPEAGSPFFDHERATSVRILIADPQPAARSALRLLLQERLQAEIVGEAAESQELLAQLDSGRPDIILLDWELPGRSTDNLLEALRVDGRQPWVIILGTQSESAAAALASGADAFVSKGDPPKRLLAAICALTGEDPRA